jgi:hypothetical protein
VIPPRSEEQKNLVFQQENIYLIRDCWLPAFPDTVEQYDHIMLKDGEEIFIGGGYLCKYKELK